jgi:hypothetical protein
MPKENHPHHKKKGENMIDAWKLDPIWRQRDITVCCWLLESISRTHTRTHNDYHLTQTNKAPQGINPLMNLSVKKEAPKSLKVTGFWWTVVCGVRV